MQDDCLIVVHGMVGLPATVLPFLMGGGHAHLEVGGPVDLAGDQQLAVQQERRLPVLDDHEPHALDRLPARVGQFERPIRSDQAAFGPEIRVDADRHVGAAQSPGEPVDAHHVVEVAVAEHHGLERIGGYAEPVEVADQPVRGDAGVEQHPPGAAVERGFDKCGESVFGAEEVDAVPVDSHAIRDDG